MHHEPDATRRQPKNRSIRGVAIRAAACALLLAATGCAGQPEPPIHEAFDLDIPDLDRLVSDLPEDIRDNIEARRWYFLELTARLIEDPRDLIRLVDKEHALPADYEPTDLVSLNRYDLRLNRTDLRIRRIVMPDLLAMIEAARIDGIDPVLSSVYRSYDYQAEVYARHVKWYGKEQADRESAQPGKSQHQLGTTIDFGSISDAFGDTAAGKWLVSHAWRYGFSLSYPEGYEELTGYRHEIWHYRYLGRVAAEIEREFFDSIQHHLLTFFHLRLDALDAAYRNDADRA